MRLLIINASPRREGNISKMLSQAAAAAKDAGAECDVINLYDKDIRPCRGCMACRTTLACPIRDDMASIAEAIKSADRIVIGTPCYWANMPGILKNMFDRLVYIFIADGKHGIPRPLLKGKRAVVIVTATTPMPFARLFGQTTGTVKSITRILMMGGIKLTTSLQIGGTRKHDITERNLHRVDRLMKRLLK